MKSPPLVRVLLRGGVVSPADLLQVVEMARRVGSDHLLPGARQDLLFPVVGTSPDAVVELFGRIGLSSAVVDTSSPAFRGGANNIASSSLAVNVVETTAWLKEAVYQRIFETFGSDPRMRVNFVDPIQGIVPLFHGDLNFVASPEEHYWYLYLRPSSSESDPILAPGLVHSGDLAKVVRLIEDSWFSGEDGGGGRADWERRLREIIGTSRPHAPDPTFAPAPLPCLEGFHPMSSGQFWLGLYRRDSRFPLDLVKALSQLAQETLVGKVAITPWKSLMIKGIRGRVLPRWEALLGEFGINTRHSSLELNWHVPILDGEALETKRRIVEELDRRDASMHGLTFTLTSGPLVPCFTSVVIQRVTEPGEKADRYDVRTAAEFDPIRQRYHTIAKRVEESRLADVLLELSRKFARHEDPVALREGIDPSRRAQGSASMPVVSSLEERWIGYQCGGCLTVYEDRYGEPSAGIDPGTRFVDLAPEWSCSLCGAGREEFALVEGL